MANSEYPAPGLVDAPLIDSSCRTRPREALLGDGGGANQSTDHHSGSPRTNERERLDVTAAAYRNVGCIGVRRDLRHNPRTDHRGGSERAVQVNFVGTGNEGSAHRTRSSRWNSTESNTRARSAVSSRLIEATPFNSDVDRSVVDLEQGAWWLPGWLDTRLPAIDFEGQLTGDQNAPSTPTPTGTQPWSDRRTAKPRPQPPRR